MTAPLVSVVIPTRDRRDWLEQAVDSVRAQTLPDWELLIVDDASTDGTAAWLRGVRGPRIRTWRQDSTGQRALARNVGLAHAAGHHVLFLDDDDRLTRGALACLADALAEHDRAVAAVGSYNERREAGSVTRRVSNEKRELEWFDDILLGWTAVSGQCLLRTQAVRSVGGWSSDFIPIEDQDLWLRLAREGSAVVLPDVVLEYRIHPGQWRPPGLGARMVATREQAVGRLPEPERRRARALVRAGTALRRGRAHLARGRRARAVWQYGVALARAPSLPFSPLMRRLAVGGLLDALGGRVLLHAARRLAGTSSKSVRGGSGSPGAPT